MVAVAALVTALGVLSAVIKKQYADNRSLHADFKNLARERMHDGELFLTALEARRRASSRPPPSNSRPPEDPINAEGIPPDAWTEEEPNTGVIMLRTAEIRERLELEVKEAKTLAPPPEDEDEDEGRE